MLMKADGGYRVHRELAAGVESVPAEPEYGRAEGDEGQVVHAFVLDLALADEEDRSEGGEAGGNVDDHAAGEVLDAPGREQSAAPDEMDEGEVHEGEPGDEEDEDRPGSGRGS